MAKKISLYLLCSLVFLILSCAHISSPGGGPVDETPPEVLSVFPAQKALNISPRVSFSFLFTEWISPTNIEQAVAVFPHVPEGFRIRVSGKKLEITPRKKLADSTTYHIELNSQLKDLRGNSIGKPYHLIVSTGARLDSGSIEGCVIDPDKRIIQPKVALYAVKDSPAFNDTLLLGTPDYLNQTDSAGTFNLTHIRRGRYVLFAFDDRNANNRFQPDKEDAYAAQEKILTLDSIQKDLKLFPVACDTFAQKIITVRPYTDTLITITWRRNSFPDSVNLPTHSYRLISIDSTKMAPEIEQVISIGKEGTEFLLLLSQPLGLSPYYLTYRFIPILPLPDQPPVSRGNFSKSSKRQFDFRKRL